jgi:cell wall-associated NlpC family hydrolase
MTPIEDPRARQLLAEAKGERGVSARVARLSALLLGSPYRVNPLVGSRETPERFIASLEAFDCVTYMESVLALSLAARGADFPDWLRRIRYEGGSAEWARRHHYMTGWIRANARLGVLRRLATGSAAVKKERLLDVVPGLPPSRVRFTCVPKSRMRSLARRLATGDLVFFASTRRHLDVFHCGILVVEGERLRMRHASKSRGGVVEQELDDFLKSNRMAGVLVARPIARIGGAA